MSAQANSSKPEDPCSQCRREHYVKDIASIAIEQNKKIGWSVTRYAVQAILWMITLFLFYITYKRELVCQQLATQNIRNDAVEQ